MNLKKTHSFEMTIQPHQAIPAISEEEKIMRRSLQSVLKDFVPRLRPKISLVTPSPLTLIPKPFDIILDADESLSELEDDLTNASSVKEEGVTPKPKSVFTDKVNEWFKQCNRNDAVILSVLDFIHKEKSKEK